MKTLISIVTCIIAVGSTAFGQYTSDLIGTWTSKDVICLDGHPSKKFDATKDSIELNYDGDRYVYFAQIGGKGWAATGSYTVTKNLITLTDDLLEGETRSFGYVLTKEDELVTIENGTYGCGESVELTTYKRK